jgi:hypothetical protein
LSWELGFPTLLDRGKSPYPCPQKSWKLFWGHLQPFGENSSLFLLGKRIGTGMGRGRRIVDSIGQILLGKRIGFQSRKEEGTVDSIPRPFLGGCLETIFDSIGIHTNTFVGSNGGVFRAFRMVSTKSKHYIWQ